MVGREGPSSGLWSPVVFLGSEGRFFSPDIWVKKLEWVALCEERNHGGNTAVFQWLVWSARGAQGKKHSSPSLPFLLRLGVTGRYIGVRLVAAGTDACCIQLSWF